MASVLRALLSSSLAGRRRLRMVPTYRGTRRVRRVLLFAGAIARLVLWSLRGRGRLVHVHATVRGSSYRKAVCVLVAKALRRRVILHVHSGAGDIAAFRSRLGRTGGLLVRAGLRRADAVLAVSAASAAALEEAAGIGPVTVVPNPAPHVDDPPDRGEPRTAARAVYLGGFENDAKGGDVLLEALPEMLERVPEASVTLAGPGYLPAGARPWIDREPRVEWVGWLDAEAKDEALRAAEVFVLSSRSEGLPVALLEAMGYGLAIVATTVGGIPDTVEDGRDAQLVAPEDPAALADALARALGDATLRRRLADGAARRAAELDPDLIAARLDDIYAELLAR